MAAATGKTASGKTIVLQSEDGKRFELSDEAARVSKLIGGMIGEGRASIPIPLPIHSRELAKVCEYCTKHAGVSTGNSAPAASMAEWDREFVGSISIGYIFNLMLAADHLELTAIVDIICQEIPKIRKHETPERIRASFNIIKAEEAGHGDPRVVPLRLGL